MIDYSNYSLKRIDYAKERLTHNLNQDGLKCAVGVYTWGRTLIFVQMAEA